MKGHLYIMRADGGPVKIGISEKPDRRRREVANASGREIVEMFETPVLHGCEILERRLHQMFAENRLPGEWFDIPFVDAVEAAKDLWGAIHGAPWLDYEMYEDGMRVRLRAAQYLSSIGMPDEIGEAFLAGLGDRQANALFYSCLIDVLGSLKRVESALLGESADPAPHRSVFFDGVIESIRYRVNLALSGRDTTLNESSESNESENGHERRIRHQETSAGGDI